MIGMNNKRSVAFGISGIVVLLVTIFIFIITKDENMNISVSLGFAYLIYSEILLFGGYIAIEYLVNKGSQIITRVGCGTILTIYTVVVFLCSIIYMIMNTDTFIGFLIVQAVAFAAAMIGMLVFLVSGHTIKENDTNVTDSVLILSNLISSLELLKANRKYGKRIGKIAEDLRFTDISSRVEVDDEIEIYISRIETALAEDEYATEVEEYIEIVALLIKKRIIQLREKKIGGI